MESGGQREEEEEEEEEEGAQADTALDSQNTWDSQEDEETGQWAESVVDLFREGKSPSKSGRVAGPKSTSSVDHPS